jgi:hypothetical protein
MEQTIGKQGLHCHPGPGLTPVSLANVHTVCAPDSRLLSNGHRAWRSVNSGQTPFTPVWGERLRKYSKPPQEGEDLVLAAVSPLPLKQLAGVTTERLRTRPVECVPS